jgi:hypothetical protein
MKDQGYLVLVKIELLRVKLLKAVLPIVQRSNGNLMRFFCIGLFGTCTSEGSCSGRELPRAIYCLLLM